MRVVAGTARSIPLKSRDGLDTRPTADRVKEAIFNILQFDVPGAEVLDLFGGSGQLAIEALSRGASHAVIVDRSPEALAVIRENLERTKLADRAEVIRADYQEYLRRCGRRFSIILAVINDIKIIELHRRRLFIYHLQVVVSLLCLIYLIEMYPKDYHAADKHNDRYYNYKIADLAAACAGRIGISVPLGAAAAFLLFS